MLIFILPGYFWKYNDKKKLETNDTCVSLHNYKAVNLEVTFWYDATALLNGFYRMANERGVPMEVITDNGGCFVATYKELKELSRLDEEKIKEAT